MGLLGAEAGAGTCVIEAPYRDERTQQERYFHGAVTGAIADTAEGYAALTLAPLTKRHSRPSIQDQLPRPSARREARGCAEVVTAGRRLFVCKAEVLAVAGGGAGPARPRSRRSPSRL
jgi:acyl-coenzyme A thioesterase PaaI-like protein